MTRKADLYAAEQRQICDRAIRILDLDDQSSVWLGDLDNDKTKQNLLLSLIPDIRRYFSFTCIPGSVDPSKSKRPWLSIAKGVTHPFYSWARKEEQRNKKRTSRFFLTLKGSEISEEVRLNSQKKTLRSLYTNGTRGGSPRSTTTTLSNDQDQPVISSEES